MRELTGLPLSELTTLHVGGPAARVLELHDQLELVTAIRELDARGEPILVLGGGSNVVVGDDGFDGTVVVIRSRGVSVQRDGSELVRVIAQAGEPWDEFVAATVASRLSGVECLSGIPGSTGATPVQNVGAYGQEVADTVLSLTAWDRGAGELVRLSALDCQFSYRSSVLRGSDRLIVLEVEFGLAPSDLCRAVRYAELARALGIEVGDRAPLDQARKAVLELRAGKGMVLDPRDPDTVSAGSFFTNPILPESDAGSLPQAAPRWPAGDGRVKVSAAWLIEQAGFARGHSVSGSTGKARISTKHTLALTNAGGGTAEELLALAREIRDGVRSRFGVTLHPEPVLVGAEL